MIFASITLPELVPILSIFAGMLGGFYVLVRFILSQSEKTTEADRKERQDLAKAVERMAAATEKNADANIKNGLEAEQRNGHLAEMVVKGQELSTKNDLLILQAVNRISVNQKVKEQKVEHQVVEHLDSHNDS